MKIYNQGKLVSPRKRNPRGEFTRKPKARTLIMIALLVGSPALFLQWSEPITYVAAEEPIVAVDHTPAKIAALKEETVNMISGCEVPNYKDGDAPIILDTNNRMSVGPMMFQIATVQEYEAKLYGKTINRLEATQIALDETKASALANDIIFKDSGANNWYNCSKKLDIAARVKLIKELEQ